MNEKLKQCRDFNNQIYRHILMHEFWEMYIYDT
jgi:hypothetical protein